MKIKIGQSVSTVEAAEICNVTPQTINRWAREGLFKKVQRVGRIYIFNKIEVELWAKFRSHSM